MIFEPIKSNAIVPKFSLGQLGNTKTWTVFATTPSTNTAGNVSATLLVSDCGGYGGTNQGAWVIQISNRGSTPTIKVLPLIKSTYDVTFGYYTEGDMFKFGVCVPSYRGTSNISVIGNTGVTIGNIYSATTMPTGWTVVSPNSTFSIGGTNLVPNSAFNGTSGWGASSSSVKLTASDNVMKLSADNSVTLGMSAQLKMTEPYVGSYTTSVYLKADGAVTVGVNLLCYKDTTSGNIYVSYRTVALTTEWQKVQFTCENVKTETNRMVLSLASTSATSYAIYVKHPMVERGTEATDWSPAPSDMAYASHTHSYLPLSGGTLTNTLTIKPATGEGGQVNLDASTANTTENGVSIDQNNGKLRIFGIPSADGKTKTGNGTPLTIDPYAKAITGDYTLNGHSIETKIDINAVLNVINKPTGDGYLKIAEITTSGYGNKIVMLEVTMPYSTRTNVGHGIISINIRGNGESDSNVQDFSWLVSSRVSSEVLYYAVSGKNIEFYRKVKSGEYSCLTLKCIDAGNFESASSWSFKLNATNTAALSTPIGTLEEIKSTAMTPDDKTKLNGIATGATNNQVCTFTTTINVSDWATDSNGGYSCTKEVTGVLATDVPEVDAVLSTDRAAAMTQLAALECICDGTVTTGDNSVLFWCYNTKPSVAITVRLRVVR